LRLPSVEECSNDQFLFHLRADDERGFLATSKKRGNQAFLAKRRFCYSYELIKKYLSKNTETFRVADFACGTGNVGLLLAEDGYKVDFVDNEDKFFEYIKLKHTKGDINFVKGDCSTFIGEQKYDAIFFGEAIEHMSDPEKTITNLRANLKTGGLLCLTTPNGDFVNCYEPTWSEVKGQSERNEKLANNIGNHVCEFTQKELREMMKLCGFNVQEHRSFLSDQISRKSLLRRVLPEKLLWKMDINYSKKNNSAGKNWGRTQIILAQRAH
jgi:2-polyprenyl-3-methyl-5-hydroxy-6-metoxy-1,4-benzoquinol methylase